MAPLQTVPTGFPDLDAALPGGGWPLVGLVEILVSRLGVGELYLLLPALASITQRPQARWCAWIAAAQPFAERGGLQFASDSMRPLEPFAPALAVHGVNLPRVLVVHAEAPLWACEQALRSGACDVAVAWMQRVPVRALRRLQFATERGRTLAFLFRGLSTRAVREPSAAVLRIAVQPAPEGTRLTIVKSRGSARRAIVLEGCGQQRPRVAGWRSSGVLRAPGEMPLVGSPWTDMNPQRSSAAASV